MDRRVPLYAPGMEKRKTLHSCPPGYYEKKKAMGKTLPLFANETIVQDYRYSVWVTNSTDAPYEVWAQCKPRANDENMVKELKRGFCPGWILHGMLLRCYDLSFLRRPSWEVKKKDSI